MLSYLVSESWNLPSLERDAVLECISRELVELQCA